MSTSNRLGSEAATDASSLCELIVWIIELGATVQPRCAAYMDAKRAIEGWVKPVDQLALVAETLS